MVLGVQSIVQSRQIIITNSIYIKIQSIGSGGEKKKIRRSNDSAISQPKLHNSKTEKKKKKKKKREREKEKFQKLERKNGVHFAFSHYCHHARCCFSPSCVSPTEETVSVAENITTETFANYMSFYLTYLYCMTHLQRYRQLLAFKTGTTRLQW